MRRLRKIPYSYIEAGSDDNLFGGALFNNSALFLNNFNEDRYFEFTITKAKVEVSGVAIDDKYFDNDDAATLKKKIAYAAVDGGKLINGKTDGIVEFVKLHLRAKFTTVNVGNIPVALYAVAYIREDGTEVRLALPMSDDDPNTFLLNGLNDLLSAATSEQERAAINEIKSYVLSYDSCYAVYFKPLTAKIMQSDLVIIPNDPDSHAYDPFFAEETTFTYTLGDDLVYDLSDAPLIGSLSREKAGEVNAVGMYAINLGTLALASTDVELKDGSIVPLNSVFKLKLGATVYYEITKRRVTVNVIGGNTKYYDEADPAIVCSIIDGVLVYGDSLKYTDEASPVRATSNAARDPVGKYNIDLTPVKIVDGDGNDVSYNYRINMVKSEFEIKPRKLVVTPFDKTVKYGDDFYTTYNIANLGVSYTVQYDNNGLLRDYSFKNGDKLSGNFGLERVAASANVASKFKVTLGTLCVKSATNKDISSNYQLVLNNTAHYYVIEKINLRFKVTNEVNYAYFGDAVQVIPVTLVSDLDPKFKVANDPSASRVQGDDVNTYEILSSNADGGIRILDRDTEQDVTSYFNINVDRGTSTFEIRKYELNVSIRDQKIIDNGNPIEPEFVYKDVNGLTVPQEMLALCKVKFTYRIINKSGKFEEGENKVIPEPYGEILMDDNFNIVAKEGVITLVYPQNNVIVELLDADEEVVAANSYVFKSFTLFETKAMYSLYTSNGQDPTKEITVELAVDEALLDKDVFVLAARKDGSFEILSAAMNNGKIVVSDSEFNYILICESKTWPYYVAAVVLVFVIVGVIFAFLRIVKRRKIRGRKARNFAEPEEEEKPEQQQGGVSPVTPNAARSNEFDDIVGDFSAIRSESEPEKTDKKQKKSKEKKEKVAPSAVEAPVSVTPVTPVEQPAVAENAVNKKAEEPKAKEKDKKKGKDKKKDSAPAAYVPTLGGGVAPRAKTEDLTASVKPAVPSASSSSAYGNDELVLGDSLPPLGGNDDDIIVSSSFDKGGDDGATLSAPSHGSTAPADDDEIVISASRRIDDE